MLRNGNNIKQRMKKHVKAFMHVTSNVTRLIAQRHTGCDIQEVEQWDVICILLLIKSKWTKVPISGKYSKLINTNGCISSW